jgi:hypothetical protein
LKKQEDPIVVVCELEADSPLSQAELKLVQDLLPDLLKDMRWLLQDKE